MRKELDGFGFECVGYPPREAELAEDAVLPVMILLPPITALASGAPVCRYSTMDSVAPNCPLGGS